MHRTLFSAVSVLTLLIAAPALAGELEAPSKIDAVTLFPDGAKVTRLLDMDLPMGATSVILHGLPASIDPASPRVSGAASAKLELGAVESRPAAGPKPPDSAQEAKLQSLRDERSVVQVKIEALETKKATIQRFARSGPERQADSLAIEKWTAAWDQISAGMANVGEDLRQANARLKEIDDAIAALDPARKIAPTAPTRDIIISVSSDAAAKASLHLTYNVRGAGWTPIYDARLDTAQRTLELARRASVHQQTGEDWSDVDLTVSTIRTATGTAAPEVNTERLNFAEPIYYDESAKSMAPANAPPVVPAPRLRAGAMMPAPTEAATEPAARAEISTYAASYHLAGRLSVPSDASQKSFLISSKVLNPKLSLKAAPALDPTAYLSTEATNDLDGPLLPGEVTLLRDDTYVGKGHIGFTESGDNFTLGFGADDKVKVTRAPVKRKENEPTWINQTKTETRDFKTTVKNLHDFPVSVTLIDRVPVSENTAIIVEQLPSTTPPTEKQVGDKRGVMSWSIDLAPNESKELHLAYRIKYPAGREIISTP